MKPIRFRFDEQKAVQVAARFILHNGGEMNYLALMKLMYLAERESLLRFGHPITGDRVVAMKHGPVLSSVYNKVSSKRHDLPSSRWHKFIPRPERYVYTLRYSGVLDTSTLSAAEIAVIDEIFARFRDKNEWELVEYTHGLPEWRDPGKTSVTIPFEAILKAGGVSDVTVAAIADEAAADWEMDKALATVR